MLGRCNRDKPIEVLHGKGEAINGARFDLIIVALLAAPKDKILANLSRTISPTTNVICRTSEGARQLLYRPLVLDREAIGFTRLGIQHAQNDDTISSLLFMKSSV